MTLSSYKKKNHIIEKFNNNYAVKHSYGTMIFAIKRYKYKFNKMYARRTRSFFQRKNAIQ